MTFAIGKIAQNIVDSLRAFFLEVGPSANLTWDPDPKKRILDIRDSYDQNSTGVQDLPRIIVSRGPVTTDKSGINSNFAQETPFTVRKGDKSLVRFGIYSGSASIVIEAANKGSCEQIADMVTHFIVWTWPELCDTYGWKEFGMPFQIGECVASSEDPNITKYTIQILVPWMIEEAWQLSTLSPLLKKINYTPTSN